MTDLTPSRLRAMIEAAERATPGPWRAGGSTGFLNQQAIDPSVGCVYGAGDQLKATADHIAACSPEVIIALCRIALAAAQGETK